MSTIFQVIRAIFTASLTLITAIIMLSVIALLFILVVIIGIPTTAVMVALLVFAEFVKGEAREEERLSRSP